MARTEPGQTKVAMLMAKIWLLYSLCGFVTFGATKEVK